MHKSHHTWTNDPKKDPELTSFFPNADKPGFRKMPDSQAEYWQEFYRLDWPIRSHIMRIVNC